MLTVAVCVAVLAVGLVPSAVGADPGTAALCGPGDNPEPGLQGDVPKSAQQSGAAEAGYNCGLALVGHVNLTNGDRQTSNANMAWSGDCAYVSGDGGVFSRATPNATQGVAVVDVSDPQHPVHVTTLRETRASQLTLETLHAVDATNGRRVLVTGEYGNQQQGPSPMNVYDVSDCAHPRLLEVFSWPENIHNLTISPNGRYVYATQPLQVVELLDGPLFDGDPTTSGVRFVGNVDDKLDWPLLGAGPIADADDLVPGARRSPADYTAHEAWSNEDGTKLYLGSQLPTFEVFTIVDITKWLADPVNERPQVISQREGRGHSMRTATIDGRRYALHSEESVFGGAYGCSPEEMNPAAGPAEPWLSDITDEANPTMRVSQFHLEINQPTNCAAQLDSGVQASVHYHDVDDPDRTTFAMMSMQNAGIRVVDIRDPAAPREVGYFNPGDVQPGAGVTLDNAWGHVRYVPATGHIWFSTATGGFWVVELEPQLRSHLSLDPVTVLNAAGRPGRLGIDVDPVLIGLTAAPAYCSLGPLATAATAPALPVTPIVEAVKTVKLP